MFQKLKSSTKLKTIFDTKNIGLYVLALVAISVTWSSVRIIQKNYDLQKSITLLEQQVAVIEQETKNQRIKNEYFKTDAYLDLAARKYFNKAAPGERLLIVPSEVAATYVHSISTPPAQKTSNITLPNVLDNLRLWGTFLRHTEPDNP